MNTRLFFRADTMMILFLFICAFSLCAYADDSSMTMYQNAIDQYSAGNVQEAKNLFHKVINDYPSTEAAAESSLSLAFIRHKELKNPGLDHFVSYDSLKVTTARIEDYGVQEYTLTDRDFTTGEVLNDMDFRNAVARIETNNAAPSEDKSVIACGSESGGWSCAALGESSWMNYQLEAMVYLDYTGTGKARWHGIGGRVGAMNEYYREGYFFVFDGCDGEMRLERYQTSWPQRKTLVTKYSNIDEPGWHKMTMKFQGPLISCLIDDEKAFEVEDRTFKTGRAGLMQMAAHESTLDQQIRAFEQVANDYPGTEPGRKALYRKGMLLQGARGEKRWEALSHFKNLSENVPLESPVYSKTLVQAAGLQMESAMDGRCSFDDALIAVNKVLNAPYVKTEETATAKQMKMECLLFQKKYEEAEQIAHNLINLYSGFPRQRLGARYALMLSAFKKGEYEQAKIEGERLLREYDKEDNYPSRDHQADALLYLARISKRGEDLLAASRYLTRLTENHKNTPQATRAQKLMLIWGLN